jgi:hypothetical protein
VAIFIFSGGRDSMKNKNHKNNKKEPQRFIVNDPFFVLWLKIMKPFLPKKVKILKPKKRWRVIVL